MSVEAIGTDARRSVGVGHAQSIRAALEFATSVEAPPDALAELKAYFRVATVEIILTLSFQLAAGFEIVRVPEVTRRADADSVVAAGSRSALNSFAEVFTLSFRAFVSDRAVNVGTALAGIRVGAYSAIDFGAHDKRISGVAFLATAIVAPRSINAHRSGSAGVSVALVNICNENTFSVISALISPGPRERSNSNRVFSSFFYGGLFTFALNVRISSKSGQTNAFDAARSLLAFCSFAARRCGTRHFLERSASFVRITDGACIADAPVN